MRFIGSLAIVFFVLNGIIALQLGLSADAAHYSLYGQHIAWSYFDHPPLVGWLQALVLPLGHNDYLMRIWPFVIAAATVLSLYYLVPRLIPAMSRYLGAVSVVFYFTAPILMVLGIDLLPQSPLLLLGLWISYALYKVSQEPSWKHWFALGLGLGVAGLAEYTAVMLAVGVFIYLVLFQPRQFFSLKPYIAALVALFCITPILYWNWQHDWVSFHYQFKHGFASFHWNWQLWSQSLLIQLLAYGPGLVMFGLLAIGQVIWRWHDAGSRILVCLALPILFLFGHSGAYERILPHWPATGWLLLIPLAARYVITYWQRWWVKALSGFSIIFMTIIYSVAYTQVMFNWVVFPVSKSPLNDLYGWPQVAQHAKQWHEPLYVNNWSLASRLAWYAQAPVQVATAKGFYQFDLWYGKPNAQSAGILVVPSGFTQPASASRNRGEFAECKPLGDLPVTVKGKLMNVYYFYHCKNFNS